MNALRQRSNGVVGVVLALFGILIPLIRKVNARHRTIERECGVCPPRSRKSRWSAAADDAILAMRDQWIAIPTRYKDQDSRACIGVFTGAKINYKRVFPDWNMTNSLLVMEKVIGSGASQVPVPIDNEAADSDLGSVLQPLEAKYADAVQLLANESAWPENSQKACDILLMCYQEIAKLPDKRSASLIRQMFTNK